MTTKKPPQDPPGYEAKTPRDHATPHKAPKNTPIELIIDLVGNKGLTHAQAAEVLGISRSAVTARLRRIGYTPERVRLYKTHRADILAWLQSQIVQHITPDKLKAASISQLGILLGILYDKERIERNQVTQITENRAFVLQATATLQEAQAELNRLKGKKAAMVLAGQGASDPDPDR